MERVENIPPGGIYFKLFQKGNRVTGAAGRGGDEARTKAEEAAAAIARFVRT
ncbi:hypothetical protein [Streptomyces sp. SBT349]|uniref:hypothetical protein n=1 Tax=Streptomyces sp. SBT349 TaxID=1580539 RepID=UPI001F486C54|nr:hypothetical protein [Streptomyces sp. SBT349]